MSALRPYIAAHAPSRAQVERVLTQQDNKVNLFRLIVNPHDFGQSVENLFYLSFLIRDAKCALDFENGEPLICVFVPFLSASRC